MSDEGVWAIVEIMGRRTRAGLISDTQVGGQTLLRIEHPTAADHTGDEPLTELYAPAAIFAIRPCSREQAAEVAAWAWHPLATKPMLAPGLEELVDDDADVDFDETFDGAPV